MYTIDPIQLRRAIERVSHAVYHGPSSHATGSVLLEFGGSNLTMVATDGVRLIADVIRDIGHQDHERRAALLARCDLGMLSRSLRPSAAVIVRGSEHHSALDIHCDDLVIRCTQADRYPRWRNVVPPADRLPITALLPRHALLRILSRIVPLHTRVPRTVELRARETEVSVRWGDGDRIADESVCCCCGGGGRTIRFDLRYLLDALTVCEAPDVLMHCCDDADDPDVPVRFDDDANPDTTYIVMPTVERIR
jgi:DNA polymerase III sliding clamp (beta) subunit (PCNA family)